MNTQEEVDFSNKIYNIDSREILNTLNESILIKSTITSPPYFDMKDYGSKNQIGFGQTYDQYLSDLKDIFQKIYKITDNDGSLWIVIDSFKRGNQVVTLPFDLSSKLKETGWLLQDIIIWKKDKTVPWSSKGFVQRKFEYILFFTKSGNFKYNKDRVRNFDTDQLKKWWVKYPERYNPKGKALDEIWEFPIPVQGSWGEKYIRHFCPLPKEMVATMIEISSDPGDLILDPFAGSGSVLFQSEAMDRKYIGFELNIDYIDMFKEYKKNNIDEFRNNYKLLNNIEEQSNFQKTILDLRALKFGRLLINAIDKIFKSNLRIFVKINEYLNNDKNLVSVSYSIECKDLDKDTILREALTIASKPPLSKFGISPNIITIKNLDTNISNHYSYTKTNSHQFIKSDNALLYAKVISEICVNIDEKDYS